MLLKLLFFISVLFSLSAVNNPIAAQKKIDTTYINVKPIVFLSSDTILRCYLIESENVVLSDYQLDKYRAKMNQIKYFSDGNIYYKRLKIDSANDTLKSILYAYNEIYYPKKLAKNQELSILYYDLKASLIFNYFEEKYSDKYIYVVSIKKVSRTDFKYYNQWFYTLTKVDLTQDSTYNFFFHTKTSKPDNGVFKVDSVAIPMKKLQKIKANLESIAVYKGKFENISSNSIDLLYIKGKGYISSTYISTLNKEGTYSIGYIKKYVEKYFDTPFNEKR
jgi:hypothetical protein